MLGLRGVAFLISVCPEWLINFGVNFIYLLAFPFLGRDRQIIVTNVMNVLKLNEHEAKAFARKVLISQFLIYLETFLYVFNREALFFEGETEYFQTVSAIKADKKGIVTFTAHLGSWELAGYFAAKGFARPMHVLAKPSKTSWINPVLDQMRTKLGMRVLWTNSKSLLRDMLTALDQGEGIGFVMDQKPLQKQNGNLVTFMGVPQTPMVQGPAQMIAKKNVPAFGSYCVRTGFRRYRLIATSVLRTEHGASDLLQITEMLSQDMEKVIRQYPEQWAWNYKRWKWSSR